VGTPHRTRPRTFLFPRYILGSGGVEGLFLYGQPVARITTGRTCNDTLDRMLSFTDYFILKK